MRRLLVAGGAAPLLTLPASAGATVTASSVDTTGGPFFDHNSDGAGLVISGHVTSDDTAADKVKLVCQGYGGQFLGPGSTGIPIAPDGSVSVDVGNNLDFWYCNARFVPFSAPAPPGPYDAAFVPTPIGVLSRNDIKFPPPNDNGVYDWYQSASGPLAYADGDSLGDCPLYTTYTIASNFGYTQLFGDCIGPYDPSDTSTSSITLDGVPTLTPYFASTYPVDSVPLITDLQRNIDPATGEVSVAGTEPLTLCAPGCLAPTSAHAHVEHS